MTSFRLYRADYRVSCCGSERATRENSFVAQCLVTWDVTSRRDVAPAVITTHAFDFVSGTSSSKTVRCGRVGLRSDHFLGPL